MRSDTKWFMDSKWGVFIHFLAAPASSSGGNDISVSAWNRRVDAFDTVGFAEQLETAGAKYIIMTLGQNTGHYCSPNASYDEIVGIQPSKCSRRDLISDLYDVLAPKGIKLLTYLPSGAPAFDPVAVKRLEWQHDGGRQAAFQQKWEAIIREWSLRWGKKVWGWWIDGCYHADDMYRHDESPNFRSFAAALKAGNPDSIVAFNPGIEVPVVSITEYEDYTAGEICTALPVFDKYRGDINRWVDGAQYHILSFLGSGWGAGSPRFPDEFVIGFTKYTNEKKGVVSWDVPTSEDNGLILQPFYEQLLNLNKALLKSET
jgi:hypothetical protein